MALFNPTTNAEFIPALWTGETIVSRENNLVFAKLVSRYDSDFRGPGDTLHLPATSDLTGDDVTVATGALPTETAVDEADLTIVINKWKAVNFAIVDMLERQSAYSLRELYTSKAGYALAKIMDSDLAALVAGFSQTTGDGTAGLSDANIRLGIQYLDEADAPAEDRFLVIKPVEKNNLISLNRFSEAAFVGQAQSEKAIIKGKLMELYGVGVYVSNNVKETAGSPDVIDNALFHRSALGLAVQKGIKVEQMARTVLANRYVASQLYGVKELRDNHGVWMKSGDGA